MQKPEEGGMCKKKEVRWNPNEANPGSSQENRSYHMRVKIIFMNSVPNSLRGTDKAVGQISAAILRFSYVAPGFYFRKEKKLVCSLNVKASPRSPWKQGLDFRCCLSLSAKLKSVPFGKVDSSSSKDCNPNGFCTRYK
ncbi:glutenin, partial [Striga asiatica]